MPWWLAGVVANACIAYVEYVNRVGQHGSFLATLPYTIVAIAIAQWGLYHSWATAPSMMLAWAVFTAGNSGFRLLSASLFVKEVIDWRQVVLVGCMFGCAYLIKQCK